MQYRRLGRSEIMVAEVGLGADALSHLDDDAGVATVRAALDAGMNVVELRAGDARAARIVGAAIERRRAQAVLVVTGPADAAALEAAIGALGVEDVDCYLLDGYLVAEPAARDDGWAALEAMRERGLTRAVGVAAAAPANAIRAVESGSIDVVQAPYRLLDAHAAEPLLAAAAAAGVGVLACSPLVGGRLARAGARASPLEFLTHGEPRTLAQAAIAWALSDARVSAVVAGASTAEQAAANAEASRMAPLPAAHLHRVAALAAGGALSGWLD